MRKGSSKLLKTLMMRLSLVTQWMSGPGNWPLTRIPCRGRTDHGRHWRIRSKEKKEVQKDKNGKEELTDLLADAEGVDVAVGDVPGEEAVGIFGGDGGQEAEECTECSSGGTWKHFLCVWEWEEEWETVKGMGEVFKVGYRHRNTKAVS